MNIQTNVRGDYMSTRRRRRRQQFQITVLLATIAMLVAILFFFQLSSNSVIGSKDYEVKYISVQVKENDTLWDLAKEFINYDYYDIDEYIDTVILINGMSSDKILPGQRLNLPLFIDKVDDQLVNNN